MPDDDDDDDDDDAGAAEWGTVFVLLGKESFKLAGTGKDIDTSFGL